MLAKRLKIVKFFDKPKTIFCENKAIIFENCLLISDLSINLFWTWSFELDQKLKSNLVGDWILTQGSKILNFVHKCKTIFWKSSTNFETFWKFHPHNEYINKLVLKFAKKLNQILIEYCYQAQVCQICLMNTKPFFLVTRQILKLSKKFAHMLMLPIKLISTFKSD